MRKIATYLLCIVCVAVGIHLTQNPLHLNFSFIQTVEVSFGLICVVLGFVFLITSSKNYFVKNITWEELIEHKDKTMQLLHSIPVHSDRIVKLLDRGRIYKLRCSCLTQMPEIPEGTTHLRFLVEGGRPKVIFLKLTEV